MEPERDKGTKSEPQTGHDKFCEMQFFDNMSKCEDRFVPFRDFCFGCFLVLGKLYLRVRCGFLCAIECEFGLVMGSSFLVEFVPQPLVRVSSTLRLPKLLMANPHGFISVHLPSTPIYRGNGSM